MAHSVSPGPGVDNDFDDSRDDCFEHRDRDGSERPVRRRAEVRRQGSRAASQPSRRLGKTINAARQPAVAELLSCLERTEVEASSGRIALPDPTRDAAVGGYLRAGNKRTGRAHGGVVTVAKNATGGDARHATARKANRLNGRGGVQRPGSAHARITLATVPSGPSRLQAVIAEKATEMAREAALESKALASSGAVLRPASASTRRVGLDSRLRAPHGAAEEKRPAAGSDIMGADHFSRSKRHHNQRRRPASAGAAYGTSKRALDKRSSTASTESAAAAVAALGGPRKGAVGRLYAALASSSHSPARDPRRSRALAWAAESVGVRDGRHSSAESGSTSPSSDRSSDSARSQSTSSTAADAPLLRRMLQSSISKPPGARGASVFRKRRGGGLSAGKSRRRPASAHPRQTARPVSAQPRREQSRTRPSSANPNLAQSGRRESHDGKSEPSGRRDSDVTVDGRRPRNSSFVSDLSWCTEDLPDIGEDARRRARQRLRARAKAARAVAAEEEARTAAVMGGSPMILPATVTHCLDSQAQHDADAAGSTQGSTHSGSNADLANSTSVDSVATLRRLDQQHSRGRGRPDYVDDAGWSPRQLLAESEATHRRREANQRHASEAALEAEALLPPALRAKLRQSRAVANFLGRHGVSKLRKIIRRVLHGKATDMLLQWRDTAMALRHREREAAATTIEAVVRGRLGRKVAAAVRLGIELEQRQLRARARLRMMSLGFFQRRARRTLQTWRRVRVQSAMKLQRWSRRLALRRGVRRLCEATARKRTLAATDIQRIYRGAAARSIARLLVRGRRVEEARQRASERAHAARVRLRYSGAANQIVHWWRAKTRLRRLRRLLRFRKVVAVTRLQHAWRDKGARDWRRAYRLRQSRRREAAAAVLTQMARRVLAQAKIARLRDRIRRRRLSQLTERKAKEREEFLQRRAKRIEELKLNQQEIRRAARQRARAEAAAVIASPSLAAQLAKRAAGKAVSGAVWKLRVAAVASPATPWGRARQERSAIAVQRRFRGFLGRREARAARLRKQRDDILKVVAIEVAAARKLQKAYRARIGRRRLEAVRESIRRRKEKEAKLIEKWLEGREAARVARARGGWAARREDAAVGLQRMWRTWWANAVERRQSHAAATTIQDFVRDVLDRREGEVEGELERVRAEQSLASQAAITLRGATLGDMLAACAVVGWDDTDQVPKHMRMVMRFGVRAFAAERLRLESIAERVRGTSGTHQDGAAAVAAAATTVVRPLAPELRAFSQRRTERALKGKLGAPSIAAVAGAARRARAATEGLEEALNTLGTIPGDAWWALIADPGLAPTTPAILVRLMDNAGVLERGRFTRGRLDLVLEGARVAAQRSEAEEREKAEEAAAGGRSPPGSPSGGEQRSPTKSASNSAVALPSPSSTRRQMSDGHWRRALIDFAPRVAAGIVKYAGRDGKLYAEDKSVPSIVRDLAVLLRFGLLRWQEFRSRGIAERSSLGMTRAQRSACRRVAQRVASQMRALLSLACRAIQRWLRRCWGRRARGDVLELARISARLRDGAKAVARIQAMYRRWRDAERAAELATKQVQAFWVDEEGRPYYVNPKTSKVSWELPPMLRGRKPQYALKLPDESLRVIVECDMCMKRTATKACDDCEAAFCDSCWDRQHRISEVRDEELGQRLGHKGRHRHEAITLFGCHVCAQQTASWQCMECNDTGMKLQCADCNDHVHKGSHAMRLHDRVPLVLMCVDCELHPAQWSCDVCGDSFCRRCFQMTHAKGRLVRHTVTYLPWPTKEQAVRYARRAEKHALQQALQEAQRREKQRVAAKRTGAATSIQRQWRLHSERQRILRTARAMQQRERAEVRRRWRIEKEKKRLQSSILWRAKVAVGWETAPDEEQLLAESDARKRVAPELAAKRALAEAAKRRILGESADGSASRDHLSGKSSVDTKKKRGEELHIDFNKLPLLKRARLRRQLGGVERVPPWLKQLQEVSIVSGEWADAEGTIVRVDRDTLKRKGRVRVLIPSLTRTEDIEVRHLRQRTGAKPKATKPMAAGAADGKVPEKDDDAASEVDERAESVADGSVADGSVARGSVVSGRSDGRSAVSGAASVGSTLGGGLSNLFAKVKARAKVAEHDKYDDVDEHRAEIAIADAAGVERRPPKSMREKLKAAEEAFKLEQREAAKKRQEEEARRAAEEEAERLRNYRYQPSTEIRRRLEMGDDPVLAEAQRERELARTQTAAQLRDEARREAERAEKRARRLEELRAKKLQMIARDTSDVLGVPRSPAGPRTPLSATDREHLRRRAQKDAAGATASAGRQKRALRSAGGPSVASRMVKRFDGT